MYIAMGMSLAAALPATVAHAASDGSLVGRSPTRSNKPAANAEVTVRNPETGFTRTVKADADGNYRFPFLPVGKYQVDATQDGAVLGKLADVTVTLGAATTANCNGRRASRWKRSRSLGTRIVTPVDVKSTESATNVTREELERLPVERDLLAVALLAPGLNKGDDDLCWRQLRRVVRRLVGCREHGLHQRPERHRLLQPCRVSRSVPYAFYKEFQVKTGGYSVEFGRTTGGVINAVTRSGTNEFEFGTEVVWEPYSCTGTRRTTSTRDGAPRHHRQS